MSEYKSEHNQLHARVRLAPAMGGAQMYRIKLSRGGESSSLYKTKHDLKSLSMMIQLVKLMMQRTNGLSCQVCASCCALEMLDTLNNHTIELYLNRLLQLIQAFAPEDVQNCSKHRGMIQVLMDFLRVRDGTSFCRDSFQSKYKRHSRRRLHCAASQSLSEKFAALDSVC
uniref:Uncharacterized protein AlNc14C330G10687 n=1 Tax=Albugo laibachii Nc14 TaxID=890382 RepID=F0WWS4_9STRA|nr:conserved hypothetical protein [Albugo laibachii Nc14]|eukprot:CCA25901.1 conserved hypothetical protein [Albugo laibachii Nc14]